MSLHLPLRLALRDLRAGLSGLHIFVACIILGVTAIAAVGSLSEAVQQGLEREGQPLLGGDIEIAVPHLRLQDSDRRKLARLGTVSEIATLRAMAANAGRHALIEIKAVDDTYPLYGSFDLAGGKTLASVLALRAGRYGVAVDPLLAARLGLAVDSELKVGEAAFDMRASIESEPDRLAEGLTLGPRVLMGREALVQTGLLKPGSLITWRYRLRLHQPASYRTAAETIEREFPDAGWRIRTRDQAAPGVNRYLERLTFFLSLVGLATLVVAGVGIANAVKTFIERRRRPIAILRLLGAGPQTVFAVYLWQVMLIASVATLIALFLGALLPFAVEHFLGRLIPVPLHAAVYAGPLALAAVFGLLTVFLFSLWPLAQSKRIGPLELVRHAPQRLRAWPQAFDILLIAAAALALAATAVFTFEPRWMMVWYIAGLASSFVLLLAIGVGLVFIARHIAKPANAAIRFALANLYRRGTALPSIVVSLGLGLTLFVTLSLIERSLASEFGANLSAQAPSYFFIDVGKGDTGRFLQALRTERTVTSVVTAPMLRGRITRVGDIKASDVKAAPEGAWALRGDRGLTYAEEIPQGSRLVQGTWWPRNYQGPPLVSLTADVAKAIGVGLGDTLSVDVLGRELTATVSSLREVDWRSLGMNFVMVFSPSALAAAPHSNLVTVSLAPEREGPFLDGIMAAFPTVTAIRVKEAIDAVGALVANLLLAVRGVGALSLLTGVLVLIGALATSLSARTYEAVILKTFGATRRQLIFVFALEFAIAGLATAIFATIMGSLAAFAISRLVLDIAFDFSMWTAVLSAVLSMLLTVATGLLTAWAALGASPAAHLKDE